VSGKSAKELVGWLAPLVLLGAALGGVALVRGGSTDWFGVILVALAGLPAAWVLVSALSPGKADRRCPACGREALARRSPDSAQGLRCNACGWADEEASAWLLAEEEGALDDIVLAERGRPARSASAGARRGVAGGVDSAPRVG
jgi:hypothetical protein